MQISRGEQGGDSQDAMLLHEYKHQETESYNTTTTTCLSSASTSSRRELTVAAAAAVMPPTDDDQSRGGVTGERVVSTHTQSGSDGVDNDNKWSHNQQNSISNNSTPASSRSPQIFQHQRQQSVSSSSSINLILSILIGMSLAAIHTSALTGGGGQSGPPASSAPTSSQQMAGGVAGTASSGSDNSAGLGETSGRSYLQPPPVTTKPQSAISLDQSPAINLIPIDQPVSTGGTSAVNSQSGPVAPSSGGQANNNFRPLKDSYDGSSINLRSSMVSSSQESGVNSPSSSSSSSSASAQADDFSSSSQFAQQQQQQSDDDFSEPIAQFYTNDGLPAEAAYQTIIEQQPVQQQEKQQQESQQAQVKSTSGPLLVTPRQSVERRFGLFKKGQHHFGSGQQQQQHYGLPAMSANYASGPYMSDCERCLASFGQQQTADLQQLDPPASLPLPPPPSLPSPAVLPVMPSLPSFGGGGGGGHYPMQPFGPLKSKFFMKFPFLVKPSPFGNGDTSGQHSYWPMSSPASYQPSQSSYQQQHQHHHQPGGLRPSSSVGGMSQALFIRPAPAYNCIQASPPLLQAAATSSSYTTSQAEVGSSKTSPVASGKQAHYGGGHHHQQQQVQQGYASKK